MCLLSSEHLTPSTLVLNASKLYIHYMNWQAIPCTDNSLCEKAKFGNYALTGRQPGKVWIPPLSACAPAPRTSWRTGQLASSASPLPSAPGWGRPPADTSANQQPHSTRAHGDSQDIKSSEGLFICVLLHQPRDKSRADTLYWKQLISESILTGSCVSAWRRLITRRLPINHISASEQVKVTVDAREYPQPPNPSAPFQTGKLQMPALPQYVNKIGIVNLWSLTLIFMALHAS